MRFDNGRIYRGDWQHDKPHGHGELLFAPIEESSSSSKTLEEAIAGEEGDPEVGEERKEELVTEGESLGRPSWMAPRLNPN